MPFGLVVAMILQLNLQEAAPLEPTQLRELVREKSAPLKSLDFVYEGHYQQPNDRGPGGTGAFDQDFQGTFLYRGDGAAYYDLYAIYPARSGGVVRKKASLLKGRIETIRDLVDSKQQIQKNQVKSREGSLMSLNPSESPADLCAAWQFGEYRDNFFHDLAIEGWETVDGRNCLRVRISVLSSADDTDKERHKRIYFFDLDRNAQVLKMQQYRKGEPAATIDEVRLKEYQLPGGGSFWFPVQSRQRMFRPGERIAASDRIVSIVAGSERFNLDLPDSLFDVRRESAYPTPKELSAGTLARQFQAQAPAPPKEPYRTDPVSVRKRIEDGLAEADRQSKELEASSPARQAWSGTTVAQVAIGVVGVGLLGFVAVRKWRGG